MKKLLFLFIILVNCILLISQTTIPGGDVSGTWLLSGSPYLIEGEITIPDGQTLTIDPGCLVEFQGHYALNVQGQLSAIGTEQDSIKFTIADTTGFSNQGTLDGGWHGIRFNETPATNDSSIIIYSIIEYGKTRFANHNWERFGGGLLCYNFSKLIIENSLFRNNQAYKGGAIHLASSSPLIRNSTFNRNYADEGGAIGCSNGTNAIIVNNIITQNTAESGGAIYFIYSSNAYLINNTICNNTTEQEGSGAVWISSSPTLINNIIYSNIGNNIHIHYYNPIIRYCNIENGLPNYPNYDETNIDLNPFFVGENDYHLNPISSCINRGIPDTTGLNLTEFDFDGNPRIYEGENPRIDIGAYEYQGEPILFFPDFDSHINIGLVPLTVQFTDLSEGDILSWEWDFNNDGVIDSYEQNPEYTFLNTGFHTISLTISDGVYSLTRTKYDYIETCDIYSFYEEKFGFNKINIDDELCSIQLFDFNGDGQKEIYTSYKNINERYFRILGIDINGETIVNDIIQIDNEEENLEKVSLIEYNNTGFVVAILKTSEVSGGNPSYNDYDIIIRVHSLVNLQIIAEDISSFNGYSGCYTKKLKTYSDSESFIYVGLRISYNEFVGGSSFDKTIRCLFSGSALIDVNNLNGIGSLLHPQSNLGAGYYYWWDDMGGSGSSISFKSLDNLFTFASSSNTSGYGLVSQNDEFFEYYGCVIYIGGYLKCYSPDFSILLWQTQMPFPIGFCSATITYENNNHYLLFYKISNETFNIINRMNGQIVYTQPTSLHPFSIKKTASGELILFENNDDEYIVYTNDPNYYTGIEEHEIPQTSQNYSLNNFPNPFNPFTTFSFSIPNKSKIEFSIYNIKGQKVKDLINETFENGSHSIIWNGHDESSKFVSSGVYLYKLNVNGKTVAVKKCLLLK